MITDDDYIRALVSTAGYKTFQGYNAFHMRGTMLVTDAQPQKFYNLVVESNGLMAFDLAFTYRPVVYYGNLYMSPLISMANPGPLTANILMKDILSSAVYRECNVFNKTGVTTYQSYDLVEQQWVSFSHIEMSMGGYASGDQFQVGVSFDGYAIQL